MEYELERFDNNHDEQTQYHQAVCDGSPHKSPIKQSNIGNLFNIEPNTTQPDDTKIGAATAAIRTVPTPAIFTATKAVVGAKPDSTTTITATQPIMALVVCNSSISKTTKKETLDLNSAKGVWGHQLGNIPQVNIGDIHLSVGCSLNLSQIHATVLCCYFSFRRNQCTTKIFC